MQGSNAKDEQLDKINVNIQENSGRPNLSEIEKFLKNNKKDLNIREVGRVPQKEVSQNFMSGEEETIEFDLIFRSDGTTAKGSYTIKPDKKGGTRARYALDVSGITDPKEAETALRNFNKLVIKNELKFHPENKKLTLLTGGHPRWSALHTQLLEEQLREHAQEFKNKGIEVYLNGKLIVGPKSELKVDDEEKQPKKPKPWDVPRGAPELTRKK